MSNTTLDRIPGRTGQVRGSVYQRVIPGAGCRVPGVTCRVSEAHGAGATSQLPVLGAGCPGQRRGAPMAQAGLRASATSRAYSRALGLAVRSIVVRSTE
jgi:hypothetical protein